jgi:hypothetical protein
MRQDEDMLGQSISQAIEVTTLAGSRLDGPGILQTTQLDMQ